MTAAAPTLSDFLLARVAEDEHFGTHDRHLAGRWDAECAAKRAIVERLHVECSGHPGPHMPHGDYGPGFCWRADEDSDILRALASIYADHQDYRSEWAL